MISTSSAVNQHPNKGKEKVGEAPAANLNIMEEMIYQGAASAKNDRNKGKEIMMVEEPKSNNKRKAIMLGEPDHSSDHGSKNPNTGAEEGGDQNSPPSSKEPSPDRLFGHVINPPARGKPKKKAPSSYNCGFCHRSFLTPQALGGHQNGHKWERHLNHGIQVINIAMGKSSSIGSPSSPTLPSCRPFTGNQGAGLNPVTMTQHLLHHHNNNPMMIMMENNGHQHDCPNYGTFQHGGTSSLDAATGAILHGAPQEAGNNTASPHPQWVGAGFGTGPTGVLEIGNIGAFQHPEGARFTPGFETGFNAGGLGSSGALDRGHGAFQHPELGWINPGIGTGNYGEDGVDNTIDEANETQQGGTSGIEFVLLPTRLYQNAGAQQVTRAEIDFGLVPKKYGEETQQDEASGIDLTLKL